MSAKTLDHFSAQDQECVVPVSLREVLVANVFQGHQIYAGEAGLDRLVRRITISELPDSLEWLAGGELICTTGCILSNDPEMQEKWLTAADAGGAAAIIIKPERFLGSIPPQMKEISDRLSLPLIGVRQQVIWPSIIQEVMDIMVSKQAQQLQRIYEIHHRLDNAVLSSAGLERILDMLSEIVGCFVVLEDRRFEPIAVSTKNVPTANAQKRARDIRVEYFQNIPQNSVKSCTFIRTLPAEGMQEEVQIIMPVTAGAHSFGWLIAFPISGEQDFVKTVLEHGASAVALEQLIHFNKIRNRTEQINQFFDRMLDPGLTVDEIDHYGRDWGVDLSAPAMILHVRCQTEPSLNDFRNCIRIVKQFDKNGLISTRNNNIYILYHPRAKKQGGIREESQRLCDWLLPILSSGSSICHIGVGELFSICDSSQFRHSFREAEICVAYAQRHNKATAFYTEIGIARLFSFFDDKTDVVAMAEELLKPLTDCDETLVTTLHAYIASSLSKTKAAKNLYIHINTLNYRLEKIQNLLNTDLSDMNTYLLLYAAMDILSVFRGSDRGDGNNL